MKTKPDTKAQIKALIDWTICLEKMLNENRIEVDMLKATAIMWRLRYEKAIKKANQLESGPHPLYESFDL